MGERLGKSPDPRTKEDPPISVDHGAQGVATRSPRIPLVCDGGHRRIQERAETLREGLRGVPPDVPRKISPSLSAPKGGGDDPAVPSNRPGSAADIARPAAARSPPR